MRVNVFCQPLAGSKQSTQEGGKKKGKGRRRKEEKAEDRGKWGVNEGSKKGRKIEKK